MQNVSEEVRGDFEFPSPLWTVKIESPSGGLRQWVAHDTAQQCYDYVQAQANLNWPVTVCKNGSIVFQGKARSYLFMFEEGHAR